MKIIYKLTQMHTIHYAMDIVLFPLSSIIILPKEIFGQLSGKV
ncbi:hypothetical protein [Flavobacterium frigoris]